MEKNFESYNYLVKYNDTTENDNIGQEILIVHENGHFVNVNKPNHNSSEVEDPKQLDTIAGSLHDDSQHPVYLQLNNSPELVPISVNPIQLAESPNVFVNNYLLQNSTEGLTAPEKYIVKTTAPFVPNLKQDCQSMEVDYNKITTEITITDEQYEILKQKGWILLEIKNDIFLLDSSGLNNINNQEFITKLKHEMHITNTDSQPTRCSLKQEIEPKDGIADINIVTKCEDGNQVEPTDITSRTKTVQGKKSEYESKQGPIITEIKSISYKPLKEHDNLKGELPEDVVETKYKCSDIHLKCQHLLKDIPKGIVLGKTINGKKLVARVVKGQHLFKNTYNIHKDMGSKKKRDV